METTKLNIRYIDKIINSPDDLYVTELFTIKNKGYVTLYVPHPLKTMYCLFPLFIHWWIIVSSTTMYYRIFRSVW